jgi:hypothetical protein
LNGYNHFNSKLNRFYRPANEEVGRDKIIKQLLEMKEEVVEYLRQILENIRDYLDNEEYLELPTGNP